MSYPHRCSKAGCRTRSALKRKITDYIRPPRCPACRRHSLRLDMAKKREGKRMACNCDGYGHTHRKGSLWCVHSTRTPDDQDYLDRFGQQL